jgi:hypothetical protein
MREKRGMYRVLCGNLRERDHWEDPGVDGRIFRGMDWMELAQDRDRWRVLVIAVLNLQVP